MHIDFGLSRMLISMFYGLDKLHIVESFMNY